MALLIALVPALTWGLMATITTKLGGTAGQQTLGTSLGALVLGLGVYLLYVLPHGVTIPASVWLTGLLSGMCWSLGNTGQYLAYKDLGVSVGLPLSTAGQIVANAVMAAVVLGGWTTGKMWGFGTLAILIIVFGATQISGRSKTGASQIAPSKMRHGLIVLAWSTLGFMLYFVFPNLMAKLGIVSASFHAADHGLTYMTAVILPQAIGQLIGALVLISAVFHEKHLILEKHSFTNILTGLTWAVGNLCMLISAGNPQVGQTVATTLSQMCVIVGTFCGIFLLHERKSHQQMRHIAVGTLLMALGGMIIANL
ncbi:GRP family sugar transporter [Lacticaseibacillus camelliae]|uniref:Glucose uptake permease n=1 Tax=Lacticaseibacillus camelliae DSM 22697 = JCM 13995 TaxID=1423730 RepID=A0A0R2FAH6_9LACO|nr:GRP family sugar transporter [Lacticaseibacillus camelliae]KRN24427.1 glucose uptake permease [Lacticaseibacillus camelliae DSM 22697 = JCM 13995]